MTKRKKVSRGKDSASRNASSQTSTGSRKKRGPNALEVLEHIEELVSDDAFEMIAMSHCSRAFRGDKKLMYEKLSAVYRAAHGFNPQHSCHHVHQNWRDEVPIKRVSRKAVEPGKASPGVGVSEETDTV